MKIIQSNFSIDDFLEEARRLADVPNAKSIATFETLLEQAFVATQAIIHRQTNSLAQSGRFRSELEGGTWTGQIEYGGDSPGSVHNPVDYAEYERERSGHDFFDGLLAYDALFDTAIGSELD